MVSNITPSTPEINGKPISLTDALNVKNDLDLVVAGCATNTINKKRWLLAFQKTGNVSLSCDMAGISHWTIYDNNWQEDAEFQELRKKAEILHLDRMAAAADKRALEGVDHPVIHQGVITGTYKEYSDTLLMFRMKKLDPSYRENNQLTINNNFPEVKTIEVCLTGVPQQVVSEGQKHSTLPQQVVEGECKEIT